MVKAKELFKKTKEQITVEKKEERKQRALSEGKAYTYISCPLCAMNRILSKGGIIASKKGKSGKVSFSSFDFDGKEKFFIQIRKNAGGRGGGFYLDKTESITWKEAKELLEYKEILQEIKEQAKKILKELS